MMDDFEIAHSDSLLEAMLCGLEAAKTEGVFGTPEPFLVMWISDSGNDIMTKSVRRLNFGDGRKGVREGVRRMIARYSGR
jgi:hypothetical protein